MASEATGPVLTSEDNLTMLLRTMEPKLSATRFAVDTLAPGIMPPANPEPFAVVAEEEGLTVISPNPDGDWAKISISFHSKLDAIGVNASIACALAHEDMNICIVAGYHHDHIFVPWDRREDAMDALYDLSES